MLASPPHAPWCTGLLDLWCCPLVSWALGMKLTYLWRSFMNLCTSLSLSLSCQGKEKIHTHTLDIIGDVKFWVMFCSWWAFLLWKESSFCSIHPEESNPSIDLFLQPLVLIYSPSASSRVHLYSNCQALKWHATFRTRLFSVNAMPILA